MEEVIRSKDDLQVALVLRPLAKLYGAFDIEKETRIKTELGIGGPVGSATGAFMEMFPAEAHVYVFALIASKVEWPDGKETKVRGVYTSGPYGAWYMPGGMTVAVVEGDPTLLMEKIQKIHKDIREAVAAGVDRKPILEAFQKGCQKLANKHGKKKP